MRTRAQLLSSALCLIVVCALEFIGAHPALAYSGCGGMNRYAHQTTVLKQWNGVYAQLYTWNPAVNSLTGDFLAVACLSLVGQHPSASDEPIC